MIKKRGWPLVIPLKCANVAYGLVLLGAWPAATSSATSSAVCATF